MTTVAARHLVSLAFIALVAAAALLRTGPAAADDRQCAIVAEMQKRIAVSLEVPAPCVHDAQCSVMHLGCPFPCAAAVDAGKRRILENVAGDYRRKQAEGGCPVCEKKCEAASMKATARCVKNRCELVPAKP